MMHGRSCELCKYNRCDGKVCEGCLEGVKPIIKFVDSIVQTDNATHTAGYSFFDNGRANFGLCSSSPSFISSKKGCENALQQLNEMKERLSHLSRFGDAFRGLHADILLKPGDNNPSLPAHKALLATSSVIFKHMFDSDEGIIRAPVGNDQTITMAELSYDELDSLLEFLYKGELPKEKLGKHARALSMAADKYDIPYLRTYCERQMLGILDKTNALDILDISSNCPGMESLTSTTMDFILKNVNAIAFTDRYEVFAANNHQSATLTFRELVSQYKRQNHNSPPIFRFPPLNPLRFNQPPFGL